MVQKGKKFTPHVVAIPVGGTVDFPNKDPIFHNVFSVSGENRFDLDLYKKPKSGTWTPRLPGLVRVYCNIHPQMSAYVLVRDELDVAALETASFEVARTAPSKARRLNDLVAEAEVFRKYGLGEKAHDRVREILKEDGSMARLPDLLEFAARHHLKIGTIEDLIGYRVRHDRMVRQVARTTVDSGSCATDWITNRLMPTGGVR